MNAQYSIKDHPCFNEKAHFSSGRIHLAVAPKCNIRCNYCKPGESCVNESRPGLAAKVITPEEAADLYDRTVKLMPQLKVAGIAGPGEPLANEESFQTFELIKERHPEALLCISTNGLFLPQNVARLKALGICSISVTVNAINPSTAGKIYQYIKYQGAVYMGSHAGEILIKNQLEGIELAVKSGLTVKVNSVFIPGVNEEEIPMIAKKVKELGAYIMNVTPLIPNAKFAHIETPTKEQIQGVRKEAGISMEQFYHCKQCRADACGIPGEKVGNGKSPKVSSLTISTNKKTYNDIKEVH